MKNFKINAMLLGLATVLTACSFVSLNPDAKNTAVATDINSLSNCKFLGNTNVSLWSKAETFQSQDKVESQLDTLARNQAATMGGNTVAPSSKINDGQRAYNVYNCPNQ